MNKNFKLTVLALILATASIASNAESKDSTIVSTQGNWVVSGEAGN